MSLLNGTAGALDTQFGSNTPRTVPTGFIVKTTSVYDATTGYSWTELRSAPGAGYAVPDLPLTGDQAYDVGGNTTIPIGTICQLTVDRDQTCYALTVSASSGPNAGAAVGGCGWVDGLLTADCLLATVTSQLGRCCTDTNAGVKLTSSDRATWTNPDADTITICGTAYTLSFTRQGCNGPCLTLTSSGSGAATYTCVRTGCGNNFADFNIGNPAVCTGDTACGGPASNVATIHVAWAHCEYDGEGWYCIEPCAGGDTAVVELTDADAGDPDITIIGGPYATEEEAQDGCGPVSTSCCESVPHQMTLVVSGLTGVCACANGTFTITHQGTFAINGSSHYWCSDAVPGTCRGVGDAKWNLVCFEDLSSWSLRLSSGCSFVSPILVGAFNLGASTTCSPFSLSATGGDTGCGAPVVSVS